VVVAVCTWPLPYMHVVVAVCARGRDHGRACMWSCVHLVMVVNVCACGHGRVCTWLSLWTCVHEVVVVRAHYQGCGRMYMLSLSCVHMTVAVCPCD
jgi:hypothetical protein